MKKGLIVAALLGLVVFAGCFHDKEAAPATDTSSGGSSSNSAPATTPSTESTAQ